VEISDYARLSTGQRFTVLSLDHGVAYFTGEPGGADTLTLVVPGVEASEEEAVVGIALPAAPDFSWESLPAPDELLTTENARNRSAAGRRSEVMGRASIPHNLRPPAKIRLTQKCNVRQFSDRRLMCTDGQAAASERTIQCQAEK